MRRIVLAAVVGIGLLLTGCQEQDHVLISRTEGAGGGQRITVTVPAVAGHNGRIVRDQLRALGLRRVSFASQDPRSRVPIMLGNWTAVKIEPAVGSRVRPTDTVVVTLVRSR